MGLLSALPFAQAGGYGPGWADYQRRQQQQQPIQYRAAQPQMPQLPSLTAPPNGQPMGPDPYAPAPVAPPVSAMPQMKEGPVQDPNASQGMWGRMNKGFSSLPENPLFNLGLSLLGNAQGSNWSGVGQDMRQYGQDQMQRQRMQNEERRLKTSDARDETVFGRQQQEWGRQDQQRQSLEEWVATLSPEQQAAARANPEAAHAAHMEAQAMASAPITPYQQAQLDLERRGQGMSYAAQMASLNRDRPLRGPDAALMDEVRDAAGRSQALTMLGDEFIRANGENGTGELSRWNPLNFVDPNRASMRASSAQMRSYMRPPGSGATSDYEQRIYAMGVPSTENTGPQNQAIMRYHQAAAQLSQQRRYFYEQYASQYGTLNGAEQMFQSSPQFQQITQSMPLEARQQPQAAAGGQGANQQQRASFDALPPASQYRDGQRITDSQTNRTFEVRGGRWVPVQQAARRDFSRDPLR